MECRSPLDRSDHTFDPVAGGILCPLCADSDVNDQSWVVSVTGLTVLRYFQRSLDLTLGQTDADISDVDLLDVKTFLRIYMRYIAERDFKSTGFLDLIKFKNN